MLSSLCHLLMKVNFVIVANMSFNAIRENKILAKISKFTVSVGQVDKHHRPRSEAVWSGSSLLACDKHSVNSSPDNHHFIREVFQILEYLL